LLFFLISGLFIKHRAFLHIMFLKGCLNWNFYFVLGLWERNDQHLIESSSALSHKIYVYEISTPPKSP